jgi:superfamily I DNA/RNA helicase
VRLKLNYRTTETIRRFADRLLPGAVQGGADEGEKRDAVSILQGPEPVVTGFASKAKEAQGLADWLRQLVKEGFKPNEIAIFGRTDVLVTDVAGSAVKIAGMAAHKLVDDEPPLGEDVFIGTMHRAKGLEFKAVAVVGVDSDHVPLRVVVDSLDDLGDRIDQGEQERQLLYVACSRARERLYISYTLRRSPKLTHLCSPKVTQAF